ncbi:protein NDR1-like [Punica granatum]|uniref:Uncharacterized protein n=2 Tax=Punica granatum TaxID=22663 RepID=A0A218XWR7_PUNGR|nr:protein NDR1-like [Punica granatum]OWM88732.1 hypothetical protein CDL15_Pgr002499 [Punica granatum]PKI32679.1 hypothetical protein CRG98_046944 [Punica granatum]
MSQSGGCCKCCLSFILTVGLTVLFMWLTLRAEKPSCSIKNFYLPALNRSLSSPGNATIFMDLRLKNGNKEKGVYYDPINVTVRSFNDSKNSLWQGMVPGFYQGYQKKATKKVTVDTTGLNWTHVAARNDSAVFRVDLSTRVRFKIVFWKTKRHKLAVRANVTVNEFGAKNSKRDIKLKSGVAEIGIQCGKVAIFLGVLALGLLNF